MAKRAKKEFALTTSGYEYDKELAKTSIKVFPSLQALIANQHDLIEIFKNHAPEKSIFLEAHISELVDVEETIAKEHAKYLAKREALKKKKQSEAKTAKLLPESKKTNIFEQIYDAPEKETEVKLDEIADRISPGLPSARLASTTKPPVKKDERDIKRIAVGASIKALRTFLRRELTERELLVIESQVDQYLRK